MFKKYKDSERNMGVELLRFIFAIIIVLGHGYGTFSEEGLPVWIVKQGAIGVEFFFVLSGILMGKKVLKVKQSENESYEKIGNETINFIKKKYVSIFPTHVLVFIIMYIEYVVWNQLGCLESLWLLISALPEFFLIYMSGLRLTDINPNDWYISAMLLAMLIIYPWLRKFRGLFSKVISPTLSLIIFGYLYQVTGTITPSGTLMMGGVFLKGTLRGIAEICLGITVYELLIVLNGKKFTQLGIVLLRFIEVGCYLSTIFVACTNVNGSWYFVFVFILALGLLISFSQYSVFKVLPDIPYIFYLGDLSMTIFVCQRIVLYPLDKFRPLESFETNIGVFVIGTLGLSVILKLCIDFMKKKFSSIGRLILDE